MPSSSPRTDEISLNLKPSSSHFLSHICLTLRGSCPPSRIAHRARNKARLFQALVVFYLHVILLARHVLLRLSRFFPYHSFSLFLRSSSTAPGTLVPQPFQWTSNLDSSEIPALVPELRAPDARFQVTTPPPLFSYRSPSFLHELLHFFPFSRTAQVPPPKECSSVLSSSSFAFAPCWPKALCASC